MSKPAMATHEADHRFTVYGYVRDSHGQPIAGERVIVVDTRLDQGNTTFTDRDGYYEALLHLHSGDLGDEIVVMVGDQRKSIRAEFDPEDRKAERRVRVDLGAPPAVGEKSVPQLRYGLIALIVVGVALVIGAIRYRRRSQKPFQKGPKIKR